MLICIQKVTEKVAAEKALEKLEVVKEKVFELNYLADEYLDGFDRVMNSLEIAKERYEELRKSYVSLLFKCLMLSYFMHMIALLCTSLYCKSTYIHYYKFSLIKIKFH